MTAYGSEKVAVQAMKRGAYDYITKPLDLEKLDVGADPRASFPPGRDREPAAARGARQEIRPGKTHRQLARHGRNLRPHPAGRPHPRHRADRGRKRHGQGTGRPVASHAQPAQGGPVRRRPLRRAFAAAAGKRTLRPRKRRLHRRDANAAPAASRRPITAPSSSTKSARSTPPPR